MQVNIHEAKNKLSNLVERAMNGEEVVIAKAGKPMVRLVQVPSLAPRTLGSAKGTITFHKGWDAPMTEGELQDFLGE